MQPSENQNQNNAPAVAPPAGQVAKSEPKTIKDWLSGDLFKKQIQMALPAILTPERFIRIALNALMKTPDLEDCTQHSVFKCLLDCASLGLEPDGRRAHLIPFKNNKAGTVECTLIIDYKGLIELGKRSGEVKTWRAELICQEDSFSWFNGKVTHKVDFLKPRGKILAVYSHVLTDKDADDFEVMTLNEVEDIRKRSKNPDSKPWKNDYNEMAKKTVIRRHSKRLTLSPEFRDALDKDDDRFEEIPLDLEGKQVLQVPYEPGSKTESIKNNLKEQAQAVNAKAQAQTMAAPPIDPGAGF